MHVVLRASLLLIRNKYVAVIAFRICSTYPRGIDIRHEWSCRRIMNDLGFLYPQDLDGSQDEMRIHSLKFPELVMPCICATRKCDQLRSTDISFTGRNVTVSYQGPTRFSWLSLCLNKNNGKPSNYEVCETKRLWTCLKLCSSHFDVNHVPSILSFNFACFLCIHGCQVRQ